ncbi:hypothetical protein BN159_8445 [Streptomyces davaonensis JCM 4913]|uniref:Pentapeptide repeat-containing protein n=1 Tax=Streptomyces davaonensis (strain DSM 101723 / JCM 4913 / KCC S-0913 / 768) TaxID=1214101 RepID=K4RG08_STRDJ|nr:pentapeptide repeat-containing protein [Streptomyces davaonensis]CCK32823.1 hypothetical protein BN159_8445 [Streptomyces davaonensis JCM 4913]
MSAYLPRRQAERRGLRLWPVGLVLAGTFAVAILVAAVVFYTGWDLLGAQGLKPERRIDSKTLFDLVKLSFGVVAGAGALVALVVAYRRQRVDEDGALREATRLHTERFTAAVTQLGEESAAVRLGGVHALAGLADDAPTRGLRQTCIDVLCAYLRLPYTAENDLPAGDTEARHTYLALREVRHTIIRLIRDHLRLEAEHPHSWQGHDFDLTQVTFDGGDLSAARFSGGTVSFRDATFDGDTINFRDVQSSGSTIDFSDATFRGGTVDFRGTTFSDGAVYFRATRFCGGMVAFSSAWVSGGTVDFNHANFDGGAVDFSDAMFTGGTVDFSDAHVIGGRIDFNHATFEDGTVRFLSTTFSGLTARYRGAADFAGAQFSGSTVHFNHANFKGCAVVRFKGAVFSDGTVDFRDARFSGGTVDFRDARGVAPVGLVPSGGASAPSGLNLPLAWTRHGRDGGDPPPPDGAV